MSKEDFISVVESLNLSNNVFFPLPIYLDIDREDYKSIKKKNLLNIFFNNIKICDIYINSIYKINSKKKLGNKLFNTKDEKHPGFANFLKTKKYFIEGKTENFNNQIIKKIIFFRSRKSIKKN